MTTAPILYQETRLSSAPTSPSAILCIDAGANNRTVTAFGAGRKRPFDEISGLDEEAYSRKYLATEGSVFFRPKSKAPRNFLWRVLDGRQLLEVQCVDLLLDHRHAEAHSWLTFRIALPSPIIPGAIALADDAERDALDIFLLTEASELYTVTLRRNLLVRETAPADFDPSTCVKSFASSSFAYKRSYRLVAVSSLELFVSFHDGSMLRLEREQKTNGSQWRETHFSEGGWSGTLKRSFHFAKPQTARYGDVDLYSDAVAAIVKSPDGKHVWTVSLDYKLKAWSTETGKVDESMDLLEQGEDEESRKKKGSYIMSAEQGTLLQLVIPRTGLVRDAVVRSEQHAYFLVLHSPKDHQFKFYGVKAHLTSVEGSRLELHDAVPRAKLIPPIDDLMDTNMWHLEQFVVHPGLDWRQSQLWLRARSGAICKTFLLQFDLLDEYDDIKSLFENGWTMVDSSYLSTESLKQTIGFCAVDSNVESEASASERWLEFLFYPGRYSEVSLESALQMYRKGRNLPTIPSNSLRTLEQPLKERIVNAISTKIIIHLSTNGQPDYDRYHADLYNQWITFFSLLSHLHNRRHDSIGFAFDHDEGLPWTVCAGYVAPIRASSTFERLKMNAELLVSGRISTFNDSVQRRIFTNDEETATSQILVVARQLRGYFSASSQAKLNNLAVSNALDQSGELSGEDGLHVIYYGCRFEEEITDSDCDALDEAADEFNGLGSLTDDHIMMILEYFDDQSSSHGTEIAARFGGRLGIAVAQETLQRTQATLLDILTLVVYLRCELEQDGLSRDLHLVEMYDAIMLHLRRNELRLWLVGHVRQDSELEHGRKSMLRSLYECLFWQDWQAKRDQDDSGLPKLLTIWNEAWIFGLSLSSSWDGITAHILAELLKHGEVDLALDFVKFLSDDWWSAYLKGRLHLAHGDYAQASSAFKDCADDCARKSAPKNTFLSAEELNYFHVGRGPYFQHIASLFENLKAFSHTAEFATLALENFRSDKSLQEALIKIDERRRNRDSPSKAKVSSAMDELPLLREGNAKEDLRNRLFNALVRTGRYELAYGVLGEVKDPALQRSNLQTLLQTCVKQDAITTMLELPISGDFVQEADTVLLSLAKRSMASGLPSGPPYHQILFAFRTQHSNFRGAAAILYEHLEHLQKKNGAIIQDPEDETLIQIYVLLINTLACCGKDEGWLLADPIPGLHDVNRKRKLVTLDDIKKDYVAELDRRSDIMQGRFPLVGGGGDLDML